MNEIIEFSNINQLPPILNAYQLSSFLGISLAGTYILLRSKDFPTISIGRRKLVPRDRLVMWMNSQLPPLEANSSSTWYNPLDGRK